jgi:uncharacterized BrkB/YihY/UPF0761 family membrane protein
MRIVLCYWLFIFAIICVEIRYMASGWAGLPGFLFTLPLSVFVATGYLLAKYAGELRGYEIHVTEYHVEYGFLICAFLNALIFYPLYYSWLRRKKSRVSQSSPPPPPLRFHS